MRGRRVIESIMDFEAAQAARDVFSYTARFLKNLDTPFLSQAPQKKLRNQSYAHFLQITVKQKTPEKTC